MKKMILVIGMVVLIALSASTASAAVPDYWKAGVLEGTYTAESDIPELQGIEFTLKADIVALNPIGSNQWVIWNIDTIGSEPGICNVHAEAEYNETTGSIEVTANGTCMEVNTWSGFMEIIPQTDGTYEIKSDSVTGSVNLVNPPLGEVGLSGDFTMTSREVQPHEILEFPTIALPIMAILGLAFFMQRRKD